MSKKIRPILFISASFLLILQFFTIAAGQDIEATITIQVLPRVRISGRYLRSELYPNTDNFTLIGTYAGVTGLTGRLIELRGRDEASRIVYHSLPGSTLSVPLAKVQSWDTSHDLSPFVLSGAAHLSWLRNDGGVIMLDELLPQPTRSRRTTIAFELPALWKAYSSGEINNAQQHIFLDAEKGVIVVGPNWRERNTDRLRLLITGEWNFADEDAVGFGQSLLADYGRLFAAAPLGKPQLVITKSPSFLAPGSWEADTRGSSITVLSSDLPFKTQSLQRLHEQLRHEIFHLWIPNGVNLTGNYDWFYEGFALYQSLKMGVAVNRIRFDDFLDTLSRAYAIDARQTSRTSMIESSRNRWNGANTDVYARGMLVAFLCDLAILEASKGKRSTSDLLREIYSKHGGNAKPEDGNAAILSIMKRHPELVTITERYATGAENFEWREAIKAAGIEADPTGRLAVSAKLSGRQKELLDRLGYNSWRKLANSK